MIMKRLRWRGTYRDDDHRRLCRVCFPEHVPLKSLSAGFEAWKAVTDAMAECGNFSPELDQEFRKKQPAAFAANPALYPDRRRRQRHRWCRWSTRARSARSTTWSPSTVRI